MEHWWNDNDRGKQSMEHWWNDTDRGKLQYSQQYLPLLHVVHHKSTDLASNPKFYVDKPATDCLSHDTANCGSIPDRCKRLFSSTKCTYRLWSPPSLIFNRYCSSFAGEGGRGGKLATQPHLSAEIKNEWSYSPLPSCVYGGHISALPLPELQKSYKELLLVMRQFAY